MDKQNVVGAQVRRLRTEKGWTQEILAAKCQLAHWNVSRATIAKIEAAIRSVNDSELYILARVLEQPIDQLYPRNREMIEHMIARSFPQTVNGKVVADPFGRYYPRTGNR